MAQADGGKGPSTRGSKPAHPVQAGRSPIQDSLDELARLADQFVDALGSDGPIPDIQPPKSASDHRALQATLEELDLLNGPPTPAKTQPIALGEDKGEDIDSFLDSVLLGDEPARARTVTAAPIPEPPQILLEAAEAPFDFADEIASAQDERVDLVCETLAPVPEHFAPRATIAGTALRRGAAVAEVRPTAQPELLASGDLPAQEFDELVDPAESALGDEVDTALAAICGEEALPAAAGNLRPAADPLIEPPSDAALARMHAASRSTRWLWLVAASTLLVIAGGYWLYRPDPVVSGKLPPLVVEGATYREPEVEPVPEREVSVQPSIQHPTPSPVDSVDAAPAPAPTRVLDRPATSESEPPPSPRIEQRPAPSLPDAPPIAVARNNPNVTFRPEPAPPQTEPAAVLAGEQVREQPDEAVAFEPDPVPQGKPEPATVAPVVVIPAYQPPIPLERTEPVYPAKALKKGEHGTIVLKVLVDERGKPVRVVVDEGIPGSELEAAAIEAILRWTFKPAVENGHQIRGWTTQRFTFTP